MLKKVILLFALFLIANFCYSQSSDLTLINQTRQKAIQTGMLTLGGWAIGNLAVSGIRMAKTEDSPFYFHQMNVFWNVVNLSLAGLGYLNAIHIEPDLSLAATVEQQYSFQKVLLFNAGLDVAYMAGGLYLLEKARNIEKNKVRFRGYGRSVLLQGAFLFTFDLTLYLILNAQNTQIRSVLEHVQLSPQGMGYIIKF